MTNTEIMQEINKKDKIIKNLEDKLYELRDGKNCTTCKYCIKTSDNKYFMSCSVKKPDLNVLTFYCSEYKSKKAKSCIDCIYYKPEPFLNIHYCYNSRIVIDELKPCLHFKHKEDCYEKIN